MALDNFKKIFNNIIKNITNAFEGREGSKFDKSQQNAILWLRKFVEDFANSKEDRVPLDNMIRWPGFFYIFKYSSKLYEQTWKNGNRKLAFYDEFPLILVLEIDKTGFLGFNFHYMPPEIRAIVLRKLVKFYRNKYINNERLAPINFNNFKQIMSGQWKFIQHGIKKYLWGHLLRIRGIKVRRVKNLDMLNSIYYISPSWVNITENEIYKLTKRI